ncbi:MAG: XTP/dITP diphosphatase [Candidatus Bathyarchaeota archaeon]|jgi:XTP/dITP diphosphohydrolase|nr:XTP/dITP diphosphatase [Candidatus Bathyarchaeota archaeon A05DMB-3]MDH7607268.1 XTP/dITP diphosphatase [Candidatus Bathyarchaeota archaeon]
MSSKLKGKVIFFATNNINKFNEARRVLSRYKIAVGMLRVKTLEIQSESLEEIAKNSAIHAFQQCHLPIIVEDAGLFVEALKGFPGPYASYVYKTIGNEGLLKLMKEATNRRARFQSMVVYFSEELESPICFKGEVLGEITETVREGCSGFGFDPVFKPLKSEKTFAEMDIDEKNLYSHRAKAFHKFARWYKSLKI